jgi:hypothetical protein
MPIHLAAFVEMPLLQYTVEVLDGAGFYNMRATNKQPGPLWCGRFQLILRWASVFFAADAAPSEC